MTDEQVGVVRFRAHTVVDGSAKYVRDEVTGSELLFDLERDPSERQDEKHREPETLARMRRQVDDWLGASLSARHQDGR
jgi:hypothetical protein